MSSWWGYVKKRVMSMTVLTGKYSTVEFGIWGPHILSAYQVECTHPPSGDDSGLECCSLANEFTTTKNWDDLSSKNTLGTSAESRSERGMRFLWSGAGHAKPTVALRRYHHWLMARDLEAIGSAMAQVPLPSGFPAFRVQPPKTLRSQS